MSDAAQLLRQTRDRHGLDQRQLARLAGTSQAQISRIERGGTSPTVETLTRLLATMGEQLQLQAEPVHGNRSVADLRADYEQLTAAERISRACALSRVLTSMGAGRRD